MSVSPPSHLRELARGRTRADQGVPARPAPHRRRRQHLRRRGAVPRRASTRCAPPVALTRAQYDAPARRRSSRRCMRASTRAAPRSTTSATSTACADPSRIGFWFTAARASPARAAGTHDRQDRRRPGAEPTSCDTASRAPRAAPASPRRGSPLAQAHSRSSRRPLCAAASVSLNPPTQLARRPAPAGRSSSPSCSPSSTRPSASLERLISRNSSPRSSQKVLHVQAVPARLSRVDGYRAHYFKKYSWVDSGNISGAVREAKWRGPGAKRRGPRGHLDSLLPMPGPLKTEAVVLRSIRYGEADRILHLYTPHSGRLGAIAKGVRRARSRFGGRLEPFFRLQPGAPRGARRAAHCHRRAHARGPCASTRERHCPRWRRPRLRRRRAAVRDDRASPRRLQPALPPAVPARPTARRRSAGPTRWRSPSA